MTVKERGLRRATMSRYERRRRLGARGKPVLAVLVATVCLLGCGSATAAAQGSPGGRQLIELEFKMANVRSVVGPQVSYTGGVVAGGGGSVQVQSGPLHAIVFANVNSSAYGWALTPGSNAPLTATVDDWRYVDSGTVTGTATVPAGASMTVTNIRTGQTTTLKNGAFSIPTGSDALGSVPPRAFNRVIRCHGGPRSCRARVNVAGGARHRRVVIRLTDTDLKLRSVKAVSRKRHLRYRLTRRHFILGGSEFVATLDAPRSSPRGSHLILTFTAHRKKGTRCRSRCAAAPPMRPVGAPNTLAEFDYKVSNVPPNTASFPNVLYTGGVIVGVGPGVGDQTLIIQSGAISEADFLANAWDLIPAGNSPLTAMLFDRRYVNGAAITGTATVAPGSTMTVSNIDMSRTITLNNGPFSLPAGPFGG